jgi:hypothetical protein
LVVASSARWRYDPVVFASSASNPFAARSICGASLIKDRSRIVPNGDVVFEIFERLQEQRLRVSDASSAASANRVDLVARSRSFWTR